MSNGNLKCNKNGIFVYQKPTFLYIRDLSRFYKLYLYGRTEAREMIFSWNGNYYYEIKVYCSEMAE